MPQDRDPDEPAIVTAFLRGFLDDKERGTARSLSDYQRRYPGHESAIAAEFARLQAGEFPDPITTGKPADPAKSEALIRGAVAGRYRDELEVARGGMGTIYRVWDPSLKRDIAKKVLGTASTDRAASVGLVERFLEEAQVTAQLDHASRAPLRGIEQNSSKTVAILLDLTVEAVDQRFSRALKRLRQRLPDSVFCELHDGE